MRCFQSAALFDAPDDFQQLGSCDVGNRFVAYPGENVPFQVADRSVRVIFRPVWSVLREPFSPDYLEAVCVPY